MSDPSVSRREFALSLAAFPALAAAVPATEGNPSPGADSPATSAPPAPQPPQKQSPAPPVEQTEDPDASGESPDEPDEIPEAAWLLGLILKRYPDERLDETAIRGILGKIESDLHRSRTLSAFPLNNSDEPGHVFRPFVGE